MIQHQATLFRPRESWRDFVLSCTIPGGNVRVAYNPGTQNGRAILARKLVEAGLDGTIEIVEINTKGEPIRSLHDILSLSTSPLAWNVSNPDNSPREADMNNSTIAGAALPSALSQTQIEALDLCPVSVTEWEEKIHHFTRKSLLERKWVFIEGGFVHAQERSVIEVQAREQKTEATRAALSKLADINAEKQTIMNEAQRAAFALCLSVGAHGSIAEAKFDEKIHGRTKRAMIERGWIVADGNAVTATPAGRAAYAEPLPEKTTSATSPKTFINPRWVEILEIMLDESEQVGPAEWAALHGKTSNGLVAAGLVTLRQTPRGNQPYVTPEGAIYAGRDASEAPPIPPEDTGAMGGADPVIARVAPSQINPRWVEVLTKIRDGKLGMKLWDDLHGKLRNSLVKNNFVIAPENSRPKLTPQGLAYLDMANAQI